MTDKQRKLFEPLLFGFFIGYLVVLLATGIWDYRQHEDASGTEQTAEEAPTRTIAAEPSAVPPEPPQAAPAEVLENLQAQRKLINAHEHVQSVQEGQRLLRVMDDFGVRKTILVGSSWFTITLNESVGFTRYDENNRELLKLAKAHPGRFEAWPTINPEDPDKLDKLKRFHQQGAAGLKLYIGHGFVKRSGGEYMFHTRAIDDPSMWPIYEYCAENWLPICFHVNPSPKAAPGFAQEFVSVLQRFPDLKVNCPHFMLSSILDRRLREFLDSFPNLYSDISFGHDQFLSAGLKRISRSPDKFRDIFMTYPDRFMWGTDLVLTNHPRKNEEWMAVRFQAYLDMLTKETYTTEVVPDQTLNGLALDRVLLEGILFRNYERFKEKKPENTKLTHPVDWNRLGVKKRDREPGDTLPPLED